MSTTTTNLGLIKPAVNDPSDSDTWGTSWNTNADTLDSVTAIKSDTYNNQTGTSYVLAASDNNKIVTLNNAAAITLTLPQQSTVTLTAGFNCEVWWVTGAGQPTFATQGSDVMETTDGGTKLRVVNSRASVKLRQVSGGTNTWSVFGDLSA